jgi:glycosyltransferase involved in cell wall biosynthesis
MQNLLTIVVPTYNEEYYIVDTLFDIIKQVGSKGVKIIIADAGSTDRTVECCNEIKNAFDLNLEITQDNRRFKKYGYLNMIKLIRRNWLNRNNLDYFKEDQGYWD